MHAGEHERGDRDFNIPGGAVGVDWQLGGFVPTFSAAPPSQPTAMDGSTSQLVAML
jgi:hypothetical protein